MANLLPGENDLTGLLAQFQPSQADTDAARKQAQLQFFLGLLGAPKGGEFQRIGQSGLLAMNSYQDRIKQEQAMRGQNVAQAAQLMGVLRQQRALDMAQQIFNGSDGTAAPAAAPGAAPSAPGMPPSASPSPSPSPSMGGGAAQTLPLAPQPAPTPPAAPAAPPQAAMQVPTWRQLMPRAEQAMLLASGDPAKITEGIRHYTDTKMGPDGTVTTTTGIPLYKMTPSGVQFFTPQGMPGEFQPFPQSSTDAEAKRTATVEGAKTAATEAAQFPFRTIVGPYGQNGAQVAGFQSQVLGNPIAQPVAQQPGRTIDLAPTLSPGERAAALADAQRSGYGQMGYSLPSARPGVVQGADPLAIRGAEKAQDVAAAQNTVIGEGQGKDFLNVIEAEKQAPGNIAKYELMKQYLGKIETGKLAPSVLGLKSVAAYVAPNLAKDWTKDVPYAQAVSALSNEIALQLRNPSGGAGMPGSMSDSDRNFLVSMAAGVSNDPRAIPLMLDARIALEKRSQEIGQIARAYRQQHGTIDEGFYQQIQDYANSHPMFKNMAVPGDAGSSLPAGWSIKKLN